MGMHMYQLEGDGRLVFVDAYPAADMILGVINKQFIGKTIEEAFPALTENLMLPEAYRRVAKEGIQWNSEQVVYEDNQINGAFHVHAFQISPGIMVAMFMDITRSKITEDKLKNSLSFWKQRWNRPPMGF